MHIASIDVSDQKYQIINNSLNNHYFRFVIWNQSRIFYTYVVHLSRLSDKIWWPRKIVKVSTSKQSKPETRIQIAAIFIGVLQSWFGRLQI